MTEHKILTPPPQRHRTLLVVGVVIAILVIALGAYAIGRTHGGAGSTTATTTVTTPTTTPTPLTVVSTVPANGATGVPSSQVVTVHLSSPVSGTAGMPAFDPPVAGSWSQTSSTELSFTPSAPFIPTTTESLTIPAGSTGPRGTHGQLLSAPITLSFTVDQATTERLQQLLAQLDYLPLSFAPSGPAATGAAILTDQTGTFAWRWPGLPAQLTSLWTEGTENVVTKGAVMNFENQHGLTVDGLAGPKVWSALLADVAAAKINTAPYTYVYVSKVVPENLTLYENGAPVIAGTAVNTGAPGADTAVGTYPVFEHVTSSRMQGTNPDGSTYDDPNVPWASYFNGGDALHGFVRATYGTPQSNGCVEMPVAEAAKVWPLTPIGTLVTIDGPAS